MSVFVLVCIAVALASFLAVALIAMSGRNRDWAKAQRTIHNLKAQEASLVEQLRHANAEAEYRIAELREELEKQWRSNHAEHCQWEWPHDGDCHWPPPALLDANA